VIEDFFSEVGWSK